MTDLEHAGVHYIHAHNTHEHSSNVASVEGDHSVGHAFADNPLQIICPVVLSADRVVAIAQAVRLQQRIDIAISLRDVCAQQIVSQALKMTFGFTRDIVHTASDSLSRLATQAIVSSVVHAHHTGKKTRTRLRKTEPIPFSIAICSMNKDRNLRFSNTARI